MIILIKKSILHDFVAVWNLFGLENEPLNPNSLLPLYWDSVLYIDPNKFLN